LRKRPKRGVYRLMAKLKADTDAFITAHDEKDKPYN
jgi:hypothetical protein